MSFKDLLKIIKDHSKTHKDHSKICQIGTKTFKDLWVPLGLLIFRDSQSLCESLVIFRDKIPFPDAGPDISGPRGPGPAPRQSILISLKWYPPLVLM